MRGTANLCRKADGPLLGYLKIRFVPNQTYFLKVPVEKSAAVCPVSAHGLTMFLPEMQYNETGEEHGL